MWHVYHRARDTILVALIRAKYNSEETIIYIDTVYQNLL